MIKVYHWNANIERNSHQNYKTRCLVVSHFFLKNFIKNLLGRPFKDFGKLITPKIHNSNHYLSFLVWSAFISQIFNLKKQQHLWYQIAILSIQMAVLERAIFSWYEILSIQSKNILIFCVTTSKCVLLLTQA